jgi:hypothetical protein
MKGPTVGLSPVIVMSGELTAPVLLLSTKLPPTVHVGEQAAVPARAVIVAATSNVMMSAFAAPTLRIRALPPAASATLNFDFMICLPS